MTRTLAALAVAMTLSAVPFTASFAASSGGGGTISDASKMALGIDISDAGNTDQSRKAFWDKMKPEDQAMVTDKCNGADGSSRQNWSSETTAFCAMLQK